MIHSCPIFLIENATTRVQTGASALGVIRRYQAPPYHSVFSLVGHNRYPHDACQQASVAMRIRHILAIAPARALEGMHNCFQRQPSLDIAPLIQPLEVTHLHARGCKN